MLDCTVSRFRSGKKIASNEPRLYTGTATQKYGCQSIETDPQCVHGFCKYIVPLENRKSTEGESCVTKRIKMSVVYTHLQRQKELQRADGNSCVDFARGDAL